MSTHTSSPWLYVKGGRIASGDGSELLASAWHPRKMPDEDDQRIDGESWIDARNRLEPQRNLINAEMEANARLIAAAPELLEALKEFVETYKALADSGDAGFWDEEEQPIQIKARSAIAKAQGGAV